MSEGMRYRALVLGSDSYSNHHGCQLVAEHLRNGLAKRDIEITAAYACPDRWDIALERQIRKADIVIVNGEGSIHHDNRIGRRLVAAGKLAAENRVIEKVLRNSSELDVELAGRNPNSTTITVWVYPDSFAAFARTR